MAVNSYREDEEVKVTSKRATVRRLLTYLKRYKKKVIGVIAAMMVAVAISLVNPLIIESAIDTYLPRHDLHGLMKLGVLALSINIVYIVMVKIRMYIMSIVSNGILRDIRQELYEHIQTLSFTFFDGRPTGKILARIMGDVNSLKQIFINSVTTLIPGFCTIIGVALIMIVKNWRLALATLCALPLMMLVVWFLNKACHKRWQVFRKKASNLNAYVHEDISGMSVVQSFTAEGETTETFDDLVDQHRDSFVSAVRLADLFGPVVNVCWGVSSMALYLTGVKLMGMRSVSVGLLVAFGTYISMFWDPVMNLARFYNQVITNITAAERIFEIMDTKAEIVDAPDAEELPPIEGGVTFEDVSFTYDAGTESETKVLKHVSFTAKPGERIALVGPTGAGKTTIVNLLSRFYDIQEGRILVDGYDLKKVTIPSLRQQMGVMTQENFIFQGTVADNIRYGRMGASMDEVIAAAKSVHAHDFIMNMEKGYDTELRERGAGLSIGQRQLIAFARTMISMPKILILDEATSSIDTQTEILVQQGIEALLHGRTSFVIAHRLSTIQNADRIFVIDGGQIVEEGSSKELLAKRGFYYDLYMAQFQSAS